MAVCGWCNQEMGNKVSCKGEDVEFPDGTKLPPIPYDPDYGGPDQLCHDCWTLRGGFHHPGCDMESCPKCGGQLISCGCLGDEE